MVIGRTTPIFIFPICGSFLSSYKILKSRSLSSPFSYQCSFCFWEQSPDGEHWKWDVKWDFRFHIRIRNCEGQLAHPLHFLCRTNSLPSIFHAFSAICLIWWNRSFTRRLKRYSVVYQEADKIYIRNINMSKPRNLSKDFSIHSV